MQIIFRCRPIKWMFKKNWYSLYRWKNPFTYPSDGMIGRVIDAGVFTIGYRKKAK